MVKRQGYTINHLRSFDGKKVNLHLKDGSTIPCVTLGGVTDRTVYYKTSQSKGYLQVKTSMISYAEEYLLYAEYSELNKV